MTRIGGTATVYFKLLYRCVRMFKRLTAWLQANGVEDRNALHTPRKEFGTQIHRSHDLFAASAALRHASIQLLPSVNP